jgi:acyl-CoA dehydrogenase
MNDELRGFRAMVRQFLQNEFTMHLRRWRQQRRPDVEAWAAAGRAGLLLSDVPEQYGGGGGTFAREAVVVEELARAGIRFASSTQSIVAHYILEYGSEEQKCRWLPRMARGDLVAAIAMSEPAAGSDLQGIRTSARRDGDEYVINGSKAFVTNGCNAGLVCVAVKTNGPVVGMKGISLVMVERVEQVERVEPVEGKGLPGYQVGDALEKIGMHEQDTCDLFFDDVRVPASNLLGGVEGRGFSQMLEQLPYERLTVAVAAVATAEEAVAITTRHVKERTAFGKPLIEFQNTRFKLAECRTEARVGRVFVDDCVERFLGGERDAVSCAMAKYWLSDSECRIVDECVQLHGGYGYLAEHPIARMWADSRVQRIYAGTNEIMKEVIAWSL